jgi:hypothetical protein
LPSKTASRWAAYSSAATNAPAELAVLVLEAAVTGERQKLGACEQLAKRGVERGVGEALSGISDHDDLTVAGVEVGKVFG